MFPAFNSGRSPSESLQWIYHHPTRLRKRAETNNGEMEVAGASAGAYVEGGGADPNEAVFHEGEPSSPSSGSGQTFGFSKILGVDLVMEELLRHLSVRQMQVLSSVSKDALIAVRRSKVFSKRVRIALDDERPCETIHWNMFTGAMKLELEDITIAAGRSSSTQSVQEIEEMLSEIPSERVTKISVFYRRYSDEAFPTLVCFSQKIGEHISRFTNLTKLSLCNLLNFDDDSLQSIIKGCPKLKNLSLDGLPELTDFGITDVNNIPTDDRFRCNFENQVVSLADLRDLARLSIQNCGPVFLTTLLWVIQFEFLTSLYFSGDVFREMRQTPREVLLGILEQNPSLKELDLYIKYGYECKQDYSLEDEAKLLYPRIRRLQFAYTSDDYYDFVNEDEWDDDRREDD